MIELTINFIEKNRIYTGNMIRNTTQISRQIMLSSIRDIAEFNVLNDSGEESIAKLIPINTRNLSRNDISILMTVWRNENAQWYPSQFTATIDRTQHWLQEHIISSRDRIIFCIVVNNEIVGHIGIATASNSNSSICYVLNTYHKPQFFKCVLRTIQRIGFDLLGSLRMEVTCLGDNIRAIKAYKKAFPTTCDKIEYLRLEDIAEGEKRYSPCTKEESNTDRYHVTFEITREQFYGSQY
jgi:RimJ/RimL family protein N-acetyltransferase